jgi:hypothetical protein
VRLASLIAFLNDERAATAIEYGLIATGIAVAIIPCSPVSLEDEDDVQRFRPRSSRLCRHGLADQGKARPHGAGLQPRPTRGRRLCFGNGCVRIELREPRAFSASLRRCVEAYQDSAATCAAAQVLRLR